MLRPVGPTRPVRLTACAAAMLALSGCSRGAVGAGPGADEVPPSAESAGYASPPALVSATRSEGAVLLEGRAQAGARVKIASPDGQVIQASVGNNGRWRAALPGAEPRMYALSADVNGRTVRAEGALLTLPQPGPPALLARAGYAVLAPPAAGARGPAITAVDFDAVGSAAVGGTAPPGARVQLAVDGEPSDLDVADPGGRFALVGPRSRPLAPGAHRFAVSSPQGTASVVVVLSPAGPLSGQAMRAIRTEPGWRVDWAVPGGGVQSTVVLDLPTEGAQ